MLGFKHSKKSRVKMSSVKTGIKLSEETRAKISSSLTGKTLPDEVRKKMSNQKLGIPRPQGAGKSSIKIEVFDIKNNTKTLYDSLSAAALDLDIKHSRISTYFRQDQKKPYQGRYIFKKL